MVPGVRGGELCEIRKRERLFLSSFSRHQQDMTVSGEMVCGTR